MSIRSPWIPWDGSPESCPGCSLAPPPPVWPQRETEQRAGAARRPGDPQSTHQPACASKPRPAQRHGRVCQARCAGPALPAPARRSPLAVSTRRGPGASHCRTGTSCRRGSQRPRTGRPSAGMPASAARSSGPRCGCCGRLGGPAAPGARGPGAGDAWLLPGRRAPAGEGGQERDACASQGGTARAPGLHLCAGGSGTWPPPVCWEPPLKVTQLTP